MRPPSLKAADFQRALGSRPLARTAHFVLHRLPCAPEATANAGATHEVAWRFGLVLPKKQARRSVTRSLIRHQAREALRRHGPAVRERGQHPLDTEGWVLRLRAPFDRQQYPSAASEALSLAVRQELDELWGRLLKGQA